MLSDNVRTKAEAEAENPVVLAAKYSGFTSDKNFLAHVGSRKGISAEALEQYLEEYSTSLDHSPQKPKIPAYSYASIEQAFALKRAKDALDTAPTAGAKSSRQKEGSEPERQRPRLVGKRPGIRRH